MSADKFVIEDGVAFTRGGHDYVGEVTRVGQRVLDVAVPVTVVDAGEAEVIAVLPFRVLIADATPVPPCGHRNLQRGCGGCDPAADEYVAIDGLSGWRRAG